MQNREVGAGNKLSIVVMVLSVLVFAASGLLFVVSGQVSVTVSIDAPEEVVVGSDFTARIEISQVENLDVCQYNISFDPSILEATDVTAGQINSTAIPVDMWNQITPGTIKVVQNVPGIQGVSGSGYLAVLHFHALSPGQSNITLSNGLLGDNQAQEIPAEWIGDSVTVTGAADTIPPAPITDLRAGNPTPISITLTWTAPGDDGNAGTASEYDIRYSTSMITEDNWDEAIQCYGEPTPQPAGSSETFTVAGLSPSTTYYFALKTADEVPNWSDLSNVPSETTRTPTPGLFSVYLSFILKNYSSGPQPTPTPTPTPPQQLPPTLVGDNFPICTDWEVQQNPAVAYNSTNNEYLVVWEDWRSGEPDIYARRLSSTGELLFSRLICAAPESQRFPAVAYNNAENEYLVVWEDLRNYNRYTNSGTVEIYGKRVRSIGAPASLDFAISSLTDNHSSYLHAVIYNSITNEYLVIFWSDDGTYGQRISSSGKLQGNNFFISAGGGSSIAYNSVLNEYLVVTATEQGIYGQRVSSTGELQGDPFCISGVRGFRAVAYNSIANEYLVVLADERNASTTGYDIYGQRISSTGELRGENFAITIAANDQKYPVVAYNSFDNEYFVVWDDERDGGHWSIDIYGQGISSLGQLQGNNLPISTAARFQCLPALAYNNISNEYLVVWQDARNMTHTNNDIYGQRVQ